MRHLILTRYNIGLYGYNPYQIADPDDWMKHRWKMFQATISGVIRQTCQDFQWHVFICPRTPLKWVCKLERELAAVAVVDTHHSLALSGYDFGGKGTLITSRLDSDDLLLPGFVAAVQREAARNAVDDKFIIDVRARKKDILSGGTLPLRRVRPDSFFISLVERTPPYLGVLHRAHSGIDQIFPATRIEETLAECRIHGRNLANRFG